MHKGFTLLELLIVIAIISSIALLGIPQWRESYDQSLLRREQQRFYLFLRQAQAQVANSNQIWYLILNRDLAKQRWCATIQRKSETSCDCFAPQFCSSKLKTRFYYPKASQTMLNAKAYYPAKLISFNAARNSMDSGCLLLQLNQYQAAFSFSNTGRIRLKNDQRAACATEENE